jgi:hypothetical protein
MNNQLLDVDLLKLDKQALDKNIFSMDDQTAVTNFPESTRINRLNNNTKKNCCNNTSCLDDNLNSSMIVLNTFNARTLGLSEEEIAELGLESEFLTTIRLVISRIFQRFLFIN